MIHRIRYGRAARACLVAVLAAAVVAGCAGRRAVSHPDPAPETAIQDTGSDTLVNLALAWAERYMEEHPQVRISVTGGGSGTGIASLINGTVQIANASREMSAEEIAEARKNGIEPVRFTVALDAIAVVANRSNPVTGLTLQQLSDVYSGRITKWSDLGPGSGPVVLLSRESNSGTYVYFLEQVIRLGSSKSTALFSPRTLLMPSSQGISSEVLQNPNAIGYDGLGYVEPEQKVIAVARSAAGPFVIPSARTVLDGTYPISRPLFMYTAGQPTGAVKDYLQWVTGEGQALVKGIGFVPLAGSSS
ncbi:MAG TPA: phosphate ABC transporter substrate-binding protein [Spirochaetia bacterium]|nr:phosphate ABC transporter substrate-binding protein [Spirochaetia bacterium]